MASINSVARLARAMCLLTWLIAATAFTYTYAATGTSSDSAPGVVAPVVKANEAAVPSAAVGKSPVKPPMPSPPAKPLWAELTPAQQQALAPLAAEWDKLDAPHKKKWLVISNKFSSLKPDQQARLQDRMRDWAKLTPEQRRVARESYSHAKKLNPGQKSAEWQQYQQLTDEQKKKLADDAAAKKRVANLPPAAQNKGKLTPPPKSAPQFKLEQPVTSPVPNQPTVQPAPQPIAK